MQHGGLSVSMNGSNVGGLKGRGILLDGEGGAPEQGSMIVLNQLESRSAAYAPGISGASSAPASA